MDPAAVAIAAPCPPIIGINARFKIIFDTAPSSVVVKIDDVCFEAVKIVPTNALSPLNTLA